MDISRTGKKSPTGVTGLTKKGFESILEQLLKAQGGSVTIRFDPEDEMDVVRLRKFRGRLQLRLYGRVPHRVVTRIDYEEISLTVWLEGK